MLKRLHSHLLLLPLIALLPFVAGCAEVSRELTISDATANDLRESTVQSVDLPGWTQEYIAATPGAERSSENANNALEADGSYICDLAPIFGLSFVNTEQALVVSSSAERVCGDLVSYMEQTLADESVYREANRDALAANLASNGVSMTNYTYKRTNLGLDDKTYVYEVRANLQTPDGNLDYAAYEVSVFSPRIVTTINIEGYGVDVPTQDVIRLAGLTRTRLNTL